MAYWLVKNEVEDYSIDDFKKEKRTLWVGVRNYQARNFLQAMKLGDEVLYYHSNGDPSGIAGLGKVSKTSIPDPTQAAKTRDHTQNTSTHPTPHPRHPPTHPMTGPAAGTLGPGQVRGPPPPGLAGVD